jgi:hypothetical protein
MNIDNHPSFTFLKKNYSYTLSIIKKNKKKTKTKTKRIIFVINILIKKLLCKIQKNKNFRFKNPIC